MTKKKSVRDSKSTRGTAVRHWPTRDSDIDRLIQTPLTLAELSGRLKMVSDALAKLCIKEELCLDDPLWQHFDEPGCTRNGDLREPYQLYFLYVQPFDQVENDEPFRPELRILIQYCAYTYGATIEATVTIDNIESLSLNECGAGLALLAALHLPKLVAALAARGDLPPNVIATFAHHDLI